jgi:hypothetical protein
VTRISLWKKATVPERTGKEKVVADVAYVAKEESNAGLGRGNDDSNGGEGGYEI